MAERRWQVPAAVSLAAASLTPTGTLEAERYRDIAYGLPLGANSLFALVACSQSGVLPTGELSEWATRVYSGHLEAHRARVSDTLTAAGVTEAFGILDPGFDEGERVVAVARRNESGQLERWGPDGWENASIEPEGLPYGRLSGEDLAEALDAVAAGGSLVFRPTDPKAYVPSRSTSAIVAAADVGTDTSGGLYAITDPLDPTSVLTLFRAEPGPQLYSRVSGAWKPDDGTLIAQLRSISPPPIITVPLDAVPAVLRQVDDFDATHPQASNHPTGGGAKSATIAASAGEPTVAGLCVRAKDTGRVFMLQRGLDPDDPASGSWEFPGGHVEAGDDNLREAAQREWEEEHGGKLPEGPIPDDAPQWTSPNGVYRGYVHDVSSESAVDMKKRGTVTNPDDPDGDSLEAVAWWDPMILKGNPAVRTELSHTVHLVHAALDPTAVAASARHEKLKHAAHAEDSKYDLERAEADHQEQLRRRAFEEQIGHRRAQMVQDGIDPDEAGAAVAREIRAEDDRRAMWERDRVEAMSAERVRRHQKQTEIRQSAIDSVDEDAPAEPIAADAAPHTAMPHQLLEYWVHGAGAAKVKWGVRGDWKRAVRYLSKYMDLYRAKAAANELHKLATGRWTGSKANKVAEP